MREIFARIPCSGFAEWPGKAPRTPEEWERTVPGLACVAEIDLSGVKPEPRRRTRSFKQCDITRALRAAKAAGVEVREIMPDGRIILGTPSLLDAITGDDDILALLR